MTKTAIYLFVAFHIIILFPSSDASISWGQGIVIQFCYDVLVFAAKMLEGCYLYILYNSNWELRMNSSKIRIQKFRSKIVTEIISEYSIQSRW